LAFGFEVGDYVLLQLLHINPTHHRPQYTIPIKPIQITRRKISHKRLPFTFPSLFHITLLLLPKLRLRTLLIRVGFLFFIIDRAGLGVVGGLGGSGELRGGWFLGQGFGALFEEVHGNNRSDINLRYYNRLSSHRLRTLNLLYHFHFRLTNSRR